MTDAFQSLGQIALTSLGFFWKAGWAFVMGYAISGMIQAFVPKQRLVEQMGEVDLRSVSLATVFGAASSSCSFAALAAARSLVAKGANFIAAVGFMFASTNLVIELGILILIFLGWPFLVAELLGGLMLIAISSLLIRATFPTRWFERAREQVESQVGEEVEDFDWRKRIRSRAGWERVGHRFVADWQMVWQEVLIGFTVAGAVAVLVPDSFWQTLFLGHASSDIPTWLRVLENAAIAPFVAASTFIGSMGNIPLATVLGSNGVLFAGIMGFIYSDLMVPPLVMINARYYGWRVALYIAAVMYVSIVSTALLMHVGFGVLHLTPESTRQVGDVARFAIDYTFYLNIAFVVTAGVLVWLHRQYVERTDAESMSSGGAIKRWIAYGCVGLLLVGVGVALMHP